MFLDHRMRGMDGIETLEKWQMMEENPNAKIPVVALTANAVSGAREKYIAAGFTDYLTKPIDSSKLENMLMKYLPSEKIRPTEGGQEKPSCSYWNLWRGIACRRRSRGDIKNLNLRQIKRIGRHCGEFWQSLFIRKTYPLSPKIELIRHSCFCKIFS